MPRIGPTTLLIVALMAGVGGGALGPWLLSGDAPARCETTDSHARVPHYNPTTSFAPAIARAAPAVVTIQATMPRTLSPPTGPAKPTPSSGPSVPPPSTTSRTGLGCGVILSGDGLILTNRHVIQEADEIHAVLADGRTLQVERLGVDPDTDLAILKANGPDLVTAPLGQSANLRAGDLVFAIGNPFGLGQTVTMGIVSATGRDQLGLTRIENFIQTDAAINPGNSGGALINAEGELVGINTAIFTETGTAQGIGFAIPIEMALASARAIAARGQVVRGWLGLSGRSVTPALAESFGLRVPRGVLVASTLEDSPAEQAGLRPGDVVTRVDDHKVATTQELLDAIAGAGPNATIALEVWRGSERLVARATTDARPAPRPD